MDSKQLAALNDRLTRIENTNFSLMCMQTGVSARTNAVRDLLRSYFEEIGVRFHLTESFDEYFKGIERAELDVILARFADDNSAMAAAMKAWLEQVKT